ncbi:hypothetical protein BDV37DRAFT_283412 [Aspergillus pseudonomiae]|uniref:Uncharacterized protein n=1 Tax=Aspergillus pseudonomiae TaxID=1506151 RepID=A0A5N7DDB3_9EURO|nr:uncharacterized protein BDV37DRAFT_283412 [Aspergillus pseudonomiae]KAE8403728.1 hypothetical protein BDV37DRAFT_283412 [Aspergillus pseudonomiae]
MSLQVAFEPVYARVKTTTAADSRHKNKVPDVAVMNHNSLLRIVGELKTPWSDKHYLEGDYRRKYPLRWLRTMVRPSGKNLVIFMDIIVDAQDVHDVLSDKVPSRVRLISGRLFSAVSSVAITCRLFYAGIELTSSKNHRSTSASDRQGVDSKWRMTIKINHFPKTLKGKHVEGAYYQIGRAYEIRRGYAL